AIESADCGTIYVSAEEPHRLVRVEGIALDPGAAAGGDRSIGFVLGVGEISKAEADEVTSQIGDAVAEAEDAPDPTDPASLPPLYTVSGELGGDCGEGSCVTTVPVTNVYGPGEGTELTGPAERRLA